MQLGGNYERRTAMRLLPALCAGLLWAGVSSAQQPPLVQFPQGNPGVPVQPQFGAPVGSGVAPGATFGQPAPFDPFGAAGTIRTPQTGIFGQSGNMWSGGSIFGGTPAPSAYGAPAYGQPGAAFTQPALPPGYQPPGAPAYGTPTYGTPPTWPGAAPATGTVTSPYFQPGNPGAGAYPYGNTPYGGSPYYGGGQTMFPDNYQYSHAARLFQDVGFSYTWVEGSADKGPTELDINEIELFATMLLPNFLNTGQPLYFTPGGALYLWEGPRPPATGDLPSKAYAAYLDFAYRTNPELLLGADLNFRMGIYSDFQTLNWDSVRFQGQGLGLLRLTPNMTAKFGVRYIDRLKYKLLPAFGVLWQPSPGVRLDIFFPQPKLSIYLSNLGNAELWAYFAAEYGGGNWTIERLGGFSDRVDINDYRVSAGLEWFGSGGWHGFVEGGFVFNREVIYYVTPGDNFNPPDTFMLRGGLSF